MVNMMKALVFTAPHTFEYRDVPRPEPAPDEVLVEVKALWDYVARVKLSWKWTVVSF